MIKDSDKSNFGEKSILGLQLLVTVYHGRETFDPQASAESSKLMHVVLSLPSPCYTAQGVLRLYSGDSRGHSEMGLSTPIM